MVSPTVGLTDAQLSRLESASAGKVGLTDAEINKMSNSSTVETNSRPDGLYSAPERTTFGSTFLENVRQKVAEKTGLFQDDISKIEHISYAGDNPLSEAKTKALYMFGRVPAATIEAAIRDYTPWGDSVKDKPFSKAYDDFVLGKDADPIVGEREQNAVDIAASQVPMLASFAITGGIVGPLVEMIPARIALQTILKTGLTFGLQDLWTQKAHQSSGMQQDIDFNEAWKASGVGVIFGLAGETPGFINSLTPTELSAARKVLGVSADATEEEIRRAAQQMAKKFHPDKVKGMEDKFKEVMNARDAAVAEIKNNDKAQDIIYNKLRRKRLAGQELSQEEIAAAAQKSVATKVETLQEIQARDGSAEVEVNRVAGTNVPVKNESGQDVSQNRPAAEGSQRIEKPNNLFGLRSDLTAQLVKPARGVDVINQELDYRFQEALDETGNTADYYDYLYATRPLQLKSENPDIYNLLIEKDLSRAAVPQTIETVSKNEVSNYQHGEESEVGMELDDAAKIKIVDFIAQKQYGNNPIVTAVKEMLQNSHDAIKGLADPSEGRVSIEVFTGKETKSIDKKVYDSAILDGMLEADARDLAQVQLTSGTRKVKITDTGIGMPPEVMKKEFLNPTESLKTISDSAGGLGLAKVVIFKNSEVIDVKSVYKLSDGHFITSTMHGSGRDWVTGKLKLKTEIDVDTETGTTIESKLTPESSSTLSISSWDVERAIRPFAELSITPYDIDVAIDGKKQSLDSDFHHVNLQKGSDVVKVSTYKLNKIKKLKEDGYVEYGNSFDNTFKLEQIDSFEGPNFKADVFITKAANSSNSPSANILNNGKYEFNMSLSQYREDGIKFPRKVAINIMPTVPSADVGYPFTINREGFMSAAGEAVKKYAQEKLIQAAIQKENDVYRNVILNAPKIGNTKFSLVDGTNSIDRKILENIANDEAVVEFVKRIGLSFDKMWKILGSGKSNLPTSYNLQFGGFIASGSEDPLLGVHVPGSIVGIKNNLIYLDIAKLLNNAEILFKDFGMSPETKDSLVHYFAEDTLRVLEHEIMHQFKGKHNAEYASALTHLPGVIANLTYSEVLKLKKVLLQPLLNPNPVIAKSKIDAGVLSNFYKLDYSMPSGLKVSIDSQGSVELVSMRDSKGAGHVPYNIGNVYRDAPDKILSTAKNLLLDYITAKDFGLAWGEVENFATKLADPALKPEMTKGEFNKLRSDLEKKVSDGKRYYNLSAYSAGDGYAHQHMELSADGVTLAEGKYTGKYQEIIDLLEKRLGLKNEGKLSSDELVSLSDFIHDLKTERGLITNENDNKPTVFEQLKSLARLSEASYTKGTNVLGSVVSGLENRGDIRGGESTGDSGSSRFESPSNETVSKENTAVENQTPDRPNASDSINAVTSSNPYDHMPLNVVKEHALEGVTLAQQSMLNRLAQMDEEYAAKYFDERDLREPKLSDKPVEKKKYTVKEKIAAIRANYPLANISDGDIATLSKIASNQDILERSIGWANSFGHVPNDIVAHNAWIDRIKEKIREQNRYAKNISAFESGEKERSNIISPLESARKALARAEMKTGVPLMVSFNEIVRLTNTASRTAKAEFHDMVTKPIKDAKLDMNLNRKDNQAIAEWLFEDDAVKQEEIAKNFTEVQTKAVEKLAELLRGASANELREIVFTRWDAQDKIISNKRAKAIVKLQDAVTKKKPESEIKDLQDKVAHLEKLQKSIIPRNATADMLAEGRAAFEIGQGKDWIDIQKFGTRWNYFNSNMQLDDLGDFSKLQHIGDVEDPAEMHGSVPKINDSMTYQRTRDFEAAKTTNVFNTVLNHYIKLKTINAATKDINSLWERFITTNPTRHDEELMRLFLENALGKYRYPHFTGELLRKANALFWRPHFAIPANIIKFAINQGLQNLSVGSAQVNVLQTLRSMNTVALNKLFGLGNPELDAELARLWLAGVNQTDAFYSSFLMNEQSSVIKHFGNKGFGLMTTIGQVVGLSDMAARAILYKPMAYTALRTLEAYRDGKINWNQLVTKNNLRVVTTPEYMELMGLVTQGKDIQFAARVAELKVSDIQALYDRAHRSGMEQEELGKHFWGIITYYRSVFESTKINGVESIYEGAKSGDWRRANDGLKFLIKLGLGFYTAKKIAKEAFGLDVSDLVGTLASYQPLNVGAGLIVGVADAVNESYRAFNENDRRTWKQNVDTFVTKMGNKLEFMLVVSDVMTNYYETVHNTDRVHLWQMIKKETYMRMDSKTRDKHVLVYRNAYQQVAHLLWGGFNEPANKRKY